MGRYQNIGPLFPLLSKAEGDEEMVLPSVSLLLEKFKIWCANHPKLEMTEQVQTLLSTISKKLGA